MMVLHVDAAKEGSLVSDFNDRLKGSSLADQARDRLRAAIIEGRLKPGEKINIERIAETFGISRTPIREALKALEMDGMVRIEPHRGALVEPLAWREIEQRYEIRSMLEGYAAELACARQDPELVESLLRNCARLKKEIDSVGRVTSRKVATIAELNNDFHRLIWQGSGSPTLIRFLETLQLPRSFSDSFWTEREVREKVYLDHRDLAEAFKAGDAAGVRSMMKKHMHASADMIASAAKAQGSGGPSEEDRLCC
jgi:GntR family transcriptional regulator, vanillate catabolism transcriptional regulator